MNQNHEEQTKVMQGMIQRLQMQLGQKDVIIAELEVRLNMEKERSANLQKQVNEATKPLTNSAHKAKEKNAG